MDQQYDSQIEAFVVKDTAGMVRELLHIQKPFIAEAATPQALSATYVQAMVSRFAIRPEEIAELNLPPADRIERAGIEYRLAEQKRIMDTSTLEYVQTYAGIRVWQAGLTVQVKHDPLRVISSQFTGLPGISVRLPSRRVVAQMEKLDSGGVAGVFGISADAALAAVAAPLQLKSTRLWIYKFDENARAPHIPQQFYGNEDEKSRHTLPMPELPGTIRDGDFYLVREIVFSYGLPFKHNLNWRALIDVATGAVLYLRALVDNVDGMVFDADPMSQTGNAANGPTANNATLNPLRQSVTLQGLDAPSGGTQSLTGGLVQISDFELATVAPPTRPTGSDFDYNARTNNFAAVNAYHHCDAFFRLVQDLGFNLGTYFNGTTFPVSVDHRGRFGSTDGIEVNASCSGTGTGGIANVDFELADLTDLTNPLGIACDWRVVLHELGGHGILWDHVNSANFGFAHSAGDSFAAILNDPGNQSPDRFVTFPWLNARRHDRAVASGWAWGGTNDTGAYNSEQILSTTLFRFYRSIGGDSADINMQRFAARYAVYLILRAVGTLTPATNPSNALGLANALLTADQGDWTSAGHAGGAYGKVIRWAFEKQGLYQPTGAPTPVTSEGDPPAVDVYINDGRNGEYGYIANFWNTTDIWNRLSPDGLTGHQTPVLSTTNHLYVRVKNRGSQTATGVLVRCYHNKPSVGLIWPDSWQSMDTPQLAVGTLAAGADTVVGPFSWTPAIQGHECLLAIVESAEDPSNVNNLGTGDSVPHWRLVPNDNNIAQRNVSPEPGGGGLKVLAEAFRRRQFWVTNPFDDLGVVKLTAHVPEILVKKQWKVRFLSAGGDSFRLSSRSERQVLFTLVPGADFSPEELGGTVDFTVSTHINGILVGGMTYNIDPSMASVPREGPVDEARPKEDCSEIAHRLLDCLDIDLPAGSVKRACVRKITVDIELDHDCC
jgi:hypothetical protein